MTRSGQDWQRLGKRAVGVLVTLSLVLFVVNAASNMGWLSYDVFEKPDSLRLGAYAGDVGALAWIAQDQGHYAAAGLTVGLKGYASGKDAMEALRAGEVDVATASEYVVATRSFAEPGLRILGSIAYYRNKGIVARRDRGIAAPGDLKGKRIGVTTPSGAEYSLYVFLALHGLSLADVTVISLAPAQIVAALSAGDIDAAITWQPHVKAIEDKLGSGGISFSGDGFDTYLLLVTRQEQLAGSSKAMEKLLRAMVQTEQWVQSHPEDAKRHVSQRFQLEPAHVEKLWPKMLLEVTLPQELLIALDGQARWLARARGQATAAIPNYSSFMRSEELKAVKPAAVTLYSETRNATAASAGR